MGRMILGAAEQTFVASVDRSVYIGAIVAVLITAVVAILLARYLSRPIRTLETAAEGLAAGDLTHRVEPAGPTEVAALGDAFNRMADSLEEAEVLRRRLIADVAHELRNPIAAARVHAEGMAEGILPPTQARFEALVSDLGHLSVLVNDLQELAIAEAGQLRYDMAPLDLADLVARETARAAESAPVRSRALGRGRGRAGMDRRRRTAPVGSPAKPALQRYPAHPGRLGRRRAYRLIPTAAWRFASPTAEKASPPRTCPTSSSASTAPTQPDAADTGGAGLGLAIARRIVEDHGGTVFVEDAPEGGAVVGFRLPIAQDLGA